MKKSTSNASNNKLFLVCPFSHMENFITKHFGEVYFLTAPAAVFRFESQEYIKQIKSFLLRENITDIYLVSDVSCDLINNIIYDKQLTGLFCEAFINQLKSPEDTPYSVSRKIITQQLTKLNCPELFAA